MGDVAGHHQASGFRVLAAHHLQPLPGIKQNPQGDAAAVAEADCPAQVPGPPTLTLFLGERRALHVAGLVLAPMVNPAVLEAKFQRAHVSGGDQLPRLDAQVGRDLLHPALAVVHLDAAGGAEGQVVGPERRSGEPQPQPGAGGEAAEGMAPGGGLRFLGVEPQVVHLIGDREPGFLRTGLQLR